MLDQLLNDMEKMKDPKKAANYARFFKTGPGQYGEGDVFLGIKVPDSRAIVKKYWKDLTLDEVHKLLNSEIHEHRLVSLLILVEKYQKAKTQIEKDRIYEFYIKNAKQVNNWDLVDSSAHKIIGVHILDQDKSIIYKLVKSDNIWKRRISIISTFYFIRKGMFADTIKISQLLLNDKHDLIHKAVGWMLREMGEKGGEKELIEFLDKYSKIMPRVMLRYAIEKLDQKTKEKYMKKD